MSKSLALVALSLLLVAGPAESAIHIAPECRVKNRPPGRCGWCALETLGRHHAMQAVYGLAARHACTCSPASLEESLRETGVRYRIQYPGCRSRAILRCAIGEELGAAVGLRCSPFAEDGGEKHIVTLVDFGPDSVQFIDSDDSPNRTRRMSMKQFLARWDGLAVVLVPDGKWVRTKQAQPRRNRVTTATRRRAASSMSARASNGLRLKRIAERKSGSATPIACSTGEGNSEPLEHAEPVEQATPARSRFINSKSAFSPGNDTLIVCGMPSSGV
jgi:hypothetical protein